MKPIIEANHNTPPGPLIVGLFVGLRYGEIDSNNAIPADIFPRFNIIASIKLTCFKSPDDSLMKTDFDIEMSLIKDGIKNLLRKVKYIDYY
ncbi:hypothetical protein HS5_23370 [Acidianus sp. HS-5]|nr:hypothetical protein HS5_23370 [Acidianus sp. HS-5]